MKKINVSSKTYPNTYAIVDNEDYGKVNKFKWHIQKRNKHIRVMCNYYEDWRNKKPILLLLHRIILNLGDDRIIDHINGNGLDNRKSNLRIVTHSQNMMNRRESNNKVKCVFYRKDNNKYRVYITANKKRHQIGQYEEYTDACKASKCAQKILHGQYSFYKSCK